MHPLSKIAIVLGQAVVVLVAFKAGEAIKAGQPSAKSWESYTSQIPPGVALNPVALNFANRNAGVILRGSYLVNGVEHCNSCHTCPPYAQDLASVPPGCLAPVNTVNYMAGGRRFGSPHDTNAPVSANLTPDPKTGLPGGLTFNQFRIVLRTGRVHQKGRTLKVMPWPTFNDLTDTDLLAIYEYLSAIPHAEPGREYPPAQRNPDSVTSDKAGSSEL